jgi:hypothetical protein
MVCFIVSVDFRPQFGHEQKLSLPMLAGRKYLLSLDLIGRGERIRTSDLTVPNLNAVKNASF